MTDDKYMIHQDLVIARQNEELRLDSSVGLNTLIGILPTVLTTLDDRGSLGLIYLDLSRLHGMENNYGWQTYDDFLKRLADILSRFSNHYSGFCMPPIVINRRSDQFILFFQPMEKNTSVPVDPSTPSAILTMKSPFDYEQLTERLLEDYEKLLEDWLRQNLTELISIFNLRVLPVNFGYSLVQIHPLIRAERNIFRNVEKAQQMALHHEEREALKLMNQLRNMIKDERIDTAFQPIFDLSNTSILGYEALSSSRVELEFQNTELLFTVAEKYGLSPDLDRLCRLKAIDRAASWLGPREKLFLNTSPQAINDGPFDDGLFFKRLASFNIKPENVVLEITERRAITDFGMFVRDTQALKKEGVKIAIDDAGAGYASLNSIVELKPDFLKFDMVMVRDIDKNLIKQDLCKTILELAIKIDAKMIAEGIETEAELETVKKLGVHLGQGYLLCRPQKRS